MWAKLDGSSFRFEVRVKKIRERTQGSSSPQGCGEVLDQRAHRAAVGQQDRRSHRWGDGISGVPFQVYVVPAKRQRPFAGALFRGGGTDNNRGPHPAWDIRLEKGPPQPCGRKFGRAGT